MLSTEQEHIQYKTMQSTSQELIIYYDSSSQSGRMVLALAHSICKNINKQDLNSCYVSATTFKQILSRLSDDPKQLMNKSHPYYQQAIRGRDFSEDEWMAILQKNPQLLKGPIVCYRNRVVLCTTPTDILKVLQA